MLYVNLTLFSNSSNMIPPYQISSQNQKVILSLRILLVLLVTLNLHIIFRYLPRERQWNRPRGLLLFYPTETVLLAGSKVSYIHKICLCAKIIHMV